jgi:hypothetical protein
MYDELYYVMDWLGYSSNDRMWELVQNLNNAPKIV